MQNDKFFQNLQSYEQILYKTLSDNDYKWANTANIHQAGVLIPKDLAVFFPKINYKISIDSQAFPTMWLENGEWKRYKSRWIHYTSKGELRLTTVSKNAFREIGPGSLLFIGKSGQNYFCCIVDSEISEEYEAAIDLLGLRESPRWGILKYHKGQLTEEVENLDSLIEIPEDLITLPSNQFLFEESNKLFRQINGDVYTSRMKTDPGNFIEELIDFQYKIYRKYESKMYTNLLVVQSEPAIYRLKKRSDMKKFYSDRLDIFSELFISMTQARKSRMGTTYELYLKKHFNENKIPFDYQLKIDGKKKPDFIIPSKIYYEKNDRKKDDVILLSVKSSVKERWAQILNEGSKTGTRYLSTLDKTVTPDAVTEMGQKNVILVVTELAKKSTESYQKASNVISLKTFTDFVLNKNKTLWMKST